LFSFGYKIKVPAVDMNLRSSIISTLNQVDVFCPNRYDG